MDPIQQQIEFIKLRPPTFSQELTGEILECNTVSQTWDQPDEIIRIKREAVLEGDLPPETCDDIVETIDKRW